MGFVGVVIEMASSIFQVPIVAGPWLIERVAGSGPRPDHTN